MTLLCLALLLLILPPAIVVLAACVRSAQISRGDQLIGGKRT